jgi:hypothetical protein
MNDDDGRPNAPANSAEKPSREERLAAKLRENLRRRKTQARALSAALPADVPAPRDDESVRLPKPPPES